MNRYTIIPLMVLLAVFIGLNAHADTGTWDYLDRPYKIGKVEEISIAYDGSDQYIFAAVSSEGGILWRTTNSGTSWDTSNFVTDHWHTRVQMKPTDAQYGWSIIPSNDGSNSDGDAGPYYTEDYGSSWDNMDGGLTNAKILHALAIDTSSTYLNTAYVGSEGNSGNSYSRLWKTTDGGQNWNLSQSGLPANDSGAVLDIAIRGDSSNYVYCIYEGQTNSGVYRSSDGGSTWNRWEVEANGDTLETAMVIGAAPELTDFIYVVEKSPVFGRIWASIYSAQGDTIYGWGDITSDDGYNPLYLGCRDVKTSSSGILCAFYTPDSSGTYWGIGSYCWH